LRELSDYLSRHPESLLRGRPKDAPAQNLSFPVKE
jgi:paraquat-inducible protein B